MAVVDLGIPRVGPTPFDDAKWQLGICNSCRYCAGYCPVWPALERRVDLKPADVTHLANLCHDCRDCYLACMYTPPHEFNVNPPKMFAAERTATYERFIWPAARLRGVSAPATVGSAVIVMAALLAVLSVCSVGGGALTSGTGSVYGVIRHDLLLVLVGAPAVYSMLVLAAAAARYWRFTHGSMRDLLDARSWKTALAEAATLRHQAGASGGCAYPGERPASARRLAHQFVMVGFTLTIISTLSAAVEQYAVGTLPPYPYLSAPVISGTFGGLLQVVGCIELIRLKRLSDPGQSTSVMRRADFAFLWALFALNGTGLLVLALRSTPAFGAVLVVHLAAVMVAFAVAPYTKFVHFIFRLLAIYKNVLETKDASARP